MTDIRGRILVGGQAQPGPGDCTDFGTLVEDLSPKDHRARLT